MSVRIEYARWGVEIDDDRRRYGPDPDDRNAFHVAAELVALALCESEARKVTGSFPTLTHAREWSLGSAVNAHIFGAQLLPMPHGDGGMSEGVCELCGALECQCDHCGDCGMQIGPDDYHACLGSLAP